MVAVGFSSTPLGRCCASYVDWSSWSSTGPMPLPPTPSALGCALSAGWGFVGRVLEHGAGPLSRRLVGRQLRAPRACCFLVLQVGFASAVLAWLQPCLGLLRADIGCTAGAEALCCSRHALCPCPAGQDLPMHWPPAEERLPRGSLRWIFQASRTAAGAGWGGCRACTECASGWSWDGRGFGCSAHHLRLMP